MTRLHYQNMSKYGRCAWRVKLFVGEGRRDVGNFSEYPLDKSGRMVYNICVRGYSLMVKLQLPKLAMRVRFPLLAPKRKPLHSKGFSVLS